MSQTDACAAALDREHAGIGVTPLFAARAGERCEPSANGAMQGAAE